MSIIRIDFYMFLFFLDMNQTSNERSNNNSSPFLVRLRQIGRISPKPDTTISPQFSKQLPIQSALLHLDLKPNTSKKDEHHSNRVDERTSKEKPRPSEKETRQRLLAKLQLKCILKDMQDALRQIQNNSKDKIDVVSEKENFI